MVNVEMLGRIIGSLILAEIVADVPLGIGRVVGVRLSRPALTLD
jgi:hypothetical protein